MTPSKVSSQKVEAVSLSENGLSDIADAVAIVNSQSLTMSPYSLLLFKFAV